MCRAIAFEAEALIIFHFHMALDTDKSMNVRMLVAKGINPPNLSWSVFSGTTARVWR
jgi:hypothetical protein